MKAVRNWRLRSSLNGIALVDGKRHAIRRFRQRCRHRICSNEATPGLVTVTAAVPADAVSVSGTVAVNWVALTKVVINAVPFQLMVEVLLKLVPVTMRPIRPPANCLRLRCSGTRRQSLARRPPAIFGVFYAVELEL